MNEDYSGVKPSHKVVEELLTRATLSSGFAVLSKGAFFAEGLVLLNSVTRQPLTINRDYKLRVLDSAATGHSYGKAVYTLIEMLTVPTADVLTTYQYVGGYHLQQRETIIRLLETLGDTDISTVYYNQLKNKPSVFTVTEEHLHDASQVTGKDQEIAALMAIREAFSRIGDNVALGDDNTLIRAIDVRLLELETDTTNHTSRINQEVLAGLIRDEGLIKLQTIVMSMSRQLMSNDLLTETINSELTSLQSYVDNLAITLLNNAKATIETQTQTISNLHTQLVLMDRLTALEASNSI